jgi:hypothetical protein
MERLLAAVMTSERRSAVRYKLQLPVIFHWIDGTNHTDGGFTCDVARDGALIRSSVCPPIGCDIQIEVLLPSPDSGSEELRIQCVGRVTRAADKGSFATFGVEGDFDDDHITAKRSFKGRLMTLRAVSRMGQKESKLPGT